MVKVGRKGTFPEDLQPGTMGRGELCVSRWAPGKARPETSLTRRRPTAGPPWIYNRNWPVLEASVKNTCF